MIYFDGNASSVYLSTPRLYWFADALGLEVVAVDYRGYGYSSESRRSSRS